MRLALISDIHGNLEALQAALDWIQKQTIDEVVCLGDIVGYGANPSECLELVRSTCSIIVKGNHDEAVCLDREMKHFNPYAVQSILWTREQLLDEQLDFLQNLPLEAEKDEFKFIHASLTPDNSWDYIFYPLQAEIQFRYFSEKICFYGHTHIPAVFCEKNAADTITPDHRYLINIGSIGQPRDRDPRAAFGVFDTEAWQYFQVRANYNVAQASAKIIQSGLPAMLAERLHYGR